MSPRRPRWARRLDRWTLRLLGLGGRALGRPPEDRLQRLTGRLRGGPAGTPREGVQAAIEAGRRALERGDLGEALVHFREAAERAPDDPWPWHGRGDALQLSGDHAGALAAYDAALERAPDNAISWCGRGNALEGLGRLDEARAAWLRALELDPGLPWARQGLERHPATGGED